MQLNTSKPHQPVSWGGQSYLYFVTHKSGDYYCCQAESDHSILHVLHHSRKDNKVGVECVENRAVDVSPLKRGKKTAINCASLFVLQLFLKHTVYNVTAQLQYTSRCRTKCRKLHYCVLKTLITSSNQSIGITTSEIFPVSLMGQKDLRLIS